MGDEHLSGLGPALTIDITDRIMHLGGFIRPIGFHAGWWRYSGGAPNANFSWPLLRRFARMLEGAVFDTLLAEDHLAVMNMATAALARSATATSFDAHTPPSAIAAVTDRIGLIARPVRGWPVIAQAGSSESGRAFAAERAELMFTAQNNVADRRLFYSEVRAGAEAAGRDPDRAEDHAGLLRVERGLR